MKIVLSRHAKEQIQIRGIPLKYIESAVRRPDNISASFRGRILYQKPFSDKMLEIVAIEENRVVTVITAYYLLGKGL